MRQTNRKGRLARGSVAEDVELVASAGSHVFGPRRKRYIDFMMGWCVGNLGWDQPEIRTALERFDGPDYVYPGYRYRPWEELAELLAAITPGKLTRCFRATGGSEAVDLALQAAMVHTGRRKFLSVEGSYHGNSIAGLSVGAGDRETVPNLLGHCHKIKPPLTRQAADKAETLLKGREVAAVILEPISLNMGVLAPDRAFVDRLRALCTHYGTLFIADEVASGFGRTGKLFACEHFGLEPDLLCLAKAITGGGAAMGAMLASEPAGRSMEKDGSFYSTYGWHPRSTAAAIAGIRYMHKHQRTLLAHVEGLSRYFRTRLAAMEFAAKPALSIWGLAVGIDVGTERYAARLQEDARRQGLLFSADGSGLLLVPALTIDRAVAEKGLDILQRCA
jgi:acetylornithine/succinyldiaminopimelate/putrescine aminotransferase